MAIEGLSDAISVTVLARMMVGSMPKGDDEEEEDAARWSLLRFRRGPTRDTRAPPLRGGGPRTSRLCDVDSSMLILRC